MEPCFLIANETVLKYFRLKLARNLWLVAHLDEVAISNIRVLEEVLGCVPTQRRLFC